MDNIKVYETALTDGVIYELIEMSKQWEAENSCHGYRKNDRSDIDGNRVFLAEDGGNIIGYLFGHSEKTKEKTSKMPENTPYFEVEELYVKPEYRNKGIGKKLFSYAEKTVSADAEYIMLSTATKNWKAILHFYLDELDMDFWSARLFKRIKN